MAIGTSIRDALLVLALAPLVYYLLAIFAGLRFFRAARSEPEKHGDFAPPISILKPIRGLDRDTYENYASFCRQDYPEFEMLFAVSDSTDPAIPEIERIIRDFPSRSIRLLIGSEPIGVSDKVNKLCRMAREARHQILLVSDSDVRVDPGFLRAVAAPFRDASVGGVTCLYRGLADISVPAILEALGNTADFAPGVLLARFFGDLNFMLGAVMAVTTSQIAAIGGFESLADYFCDDYELGNRIAGSGRRVVLSKFPVSIVYPREDLGAAFRHQLRWNLSIRYSRPWGHFGLLLSQGLPWAILGAVLAPSAATAGGYLAAYLVLRCSLAFVVGTRGMQDETVRSYWRLLPLRDLFAFAVWIASFFPQRIRWRDSEFYVREKRLVPVKPHS
ncbi:MAG: bacteriohopanetetrol glucosamine biosynthesis glycosyltransferase HpnI [Candidatus Acidiferrales bacterium]